MKFLTMLICTAGLAFSVSAFNPPSFPGGTMGGTASAGPYNLRGYGKISVEGRVWKTPSGEVALTQFTAESPEKARIAGSKYLADLLNYGAVKKSSRKDVTLEIRHGGLWKLGLDGRHLMVLSAPDEASFRKAAALWKASRWTAVPENAYPRYLDNFDNAALAIWWMPDHKKPEEMKWMKENPVIANLHYLLMNHAFAPNVMDASAPKHARAQIAELKRPYRTMMWSGSANGGWYGWIKMQGGAHERYPDGFTGKDFFEAGGYYSNQTAADLLNDLQINSMYQLMDQWKDDPDLLAWMEPHGEFQFFDPPNVPPNADVRFREFLKKKYDLNSLSGAWFGKSGALKSWNDVTFFDPVYFYGRCGSYLDLDNHEWKWKQATLADGEKEGFFKQDYEDSGWFSAKRTNKRLLTYVNKRNSKESQKKVSLWTRFSVDVPADFQKKPVWLHIMPYTGRNSRELAVWINGKEAGRGIVGNIWYKNVHSELDISKLLKPGKNDFVIHSQGGRIAYRVFLNHASAGKYPFADTGLNRRFTDWRDYLNGEKLITLEKYLRAMRSLDPDRPIKVMTPNQWLSDAFDLFERYGAYPQLTGETSWYRPMHYKGYTMLRNRLSSSEPGGPVNNPRNGQCMFAMAFFESQDAHDYGFDFTRDFWRFPSVPKWWAENRALLKTFGKTNLRNHGLGLLRDTQQDSRYTNGMIWNWDMSRGPLPALGLSPVLVDGKELEKGKADNGISVMFDCATIVMDKPLVEAVKRFVRNGGVFVAQHHTGRNTPEIRDAWPLPVAFGLRVRDSKGGKIRFSEKQNLFPNQRGKQFGGYGAAITHTGEMLTGAVAMQGKNVIPVAKWEDGSLAIAEVPYGKGRFIMLGSPFYLSFRDDAGKWLNEEKRQELLAELLASLGISRETGTEDPRVWFERRMSKNGLYDVYFAGALGWKGNKWTLADRLNSELTIRRSAPVRAAVDVTSSGLPDVAVSAKRGAYSLGKQTFSPYQIRQFAVIRENVGAEGPAAWLREQEKAWYALRPVKSDDRKRSAEVTRKYAEKLGVDGQTISADWRVIVDPSRQQLASWLTANPASWRRGAIGSWLSQGWPDAKQVLYRKTVEIPSAWRNGKSDVWLCLGGMTHQGIRDRGALFLNGKAINAELSNTFHIKLADEIVKKGKMEVALNVTAKAGGNKVTGVTGTLYLLKMPKISAVIPLTGAWTRLADMMTERGKVTIPYRGKLYGISRKVMIPESWKGKVIRLVVDENPKANRVWGKVRGAILNGEYYLREESFGAYGVRADAYLIPGRENTIELFGNGHESSENPQAFDADIRSIRLEAY